jgi:hypothetical protein
VVTWALRVAWVSLPFAAGPAWADALDGADAAIRTTASVGLWAVWAVVLLATLLPRPVGLTAVRVAAPAALAAAVAAAAAGHASAPALAATLAAAALALAPEVGRVFVNGAAYGDESRHLLRPPGPLLLGPLELAWAVTVAGVAAGPLLLADRQWVAGALAVAVGGPAAALAARSLHGLVDRWAVFVPAGLVLHDHLALTDPFLFRRSSVTRLGPATVGTDALDLTQRSPGLALALRVDAEVSLPVARPRARLPEMTPARALMFTPTRPGAVLAEARRRRFPVDPAGPAGPAGPHPHHPVL